MALNGTAMKNAVMASIQSATGNELPEIAETVWQAVCDAIVTYITTNAVVNVASVSGVTVGAGVSGPGLGVIT